MQVVTLTLNVAVDQTVSLDQLVPGQVNRAKAVYLNAGGKGLNVSSCLADWGLRSCASGILGQYNAALFRALCAQKGIEDNFVTIKGESRINIKLADKTGTTDINLPGIRVNATALEQVEAVLDSRRNADMFVFSGSLPEGCPPDIYARLIAKFGKRDGGGKKIILDTSGEPLRLALESEICPYCLKPNLQELCELTGELASTVEDAARLAAGLLKNGVELIVVSLGEGGAVFIDREQALFARKPARHVLSTVGAGDAMVAGIVAAHAAAMKRKQSVELEQLAQVATAFSVAKLGMIGPNLPPRAEVRALIREVNVRPLQI